MNRSRAVVLASITLLVLLAGSVGVRLLARRGASNPAAPPLKLARWEGKPPVAKVPAPKPIDLASLKVPCWSCYESEGWPVASRAELDLIAPLGTGGANAAQWLKDFTKQVGSREAEAEEALKRRVDGPGSYGKVLAPDDPLLLEAEPWADQAVMRFYPDYFPMGGFHRWSPNISLAFALAKGWAARAALHPEAPTALEDCRRAIRWGRLFRQEDATIVGDLIGLTCIRFGAEQLYDLAARRGDVPLALAASVVLGELGPQRLLTARFINRHELGSEKGLDLTDGMLERIVSSAKEFSGRRFRLEAICGLGVARAVGTRSQRRQAEATLDELSRSPDTFISAAALWARTTELDRAQFLELLKFQKMN